MLNSIKRMFGAQDMTTGNVMHSLVQFSIPLLIGNFAQLLYNTVDAVVVGKYVGDTALAAVGVAGPIVNLLIVLFVGISTGAGIMVSQYYGAKDKETLSKTVGTSLTLTFYSSIIMLLLGVFLSPLLLEMMDTPAEIFDGAVAYMRILFIGIFGCALYNIVSGILRGLGDSMYPLLFLILASVLNIVLDILFVASFNMGVAGVALATIIAQAISGALCVWRLFKMRDTLTLTRQTLRTDKALAIRLCKLGLPSGLSQAIFSMSALVVQGLTNSLGTLVIATTTVVMRVDGFCMMPNFTFGTAATTLVGQNVGAGKMDRVKEGTKNSMQLGLIVACCLTACILLFGRGLMSIFTNTQEVIDLGARMMQILAVGYIAFCVTQVLSGVMRGAGETVIPMWISLITTVAIRVPIAYAMAAMTKSAAYPNGDPSCLYYSLLASWLLGALLTALFYKKGKWRQKAIQFYELEEDATHEK